MQENSVNEVFFLYYYYLFLHETCLNKYLNVVTYRPFKFVLFFRRTKLSAVKIPNIFLMSEMLWFTSFVLAEYFIIKICFKISMSELKLFYSRYLY